MESNSVFTTEKEVFNRIKELKEKRSSKRKYKNLLDSS